MKRQEVERMVPLLKSILTSLQECWEGIHPVRTEIEMLERKETRTLQDACTIEQLRIEFDDGVKKMNSIVSEVEELGGCVVEFKKTTAAFRVLENGQDLMLTYNIQEGMKFKRVEEIFAEV